MKDIVVVSATRFNEREFWAKAALAKSLTFGKTFSNVSHHILFGNAGPNAAGLSEFYNCHITEENAGKIILFVHDDVLINDFLFPWHLDQAINQFDVFGIAGNRHASFDASSWALKFDTAGRFIGWYDHLAGAVGHLTPEGTGMTVYGDSSCSCDLIDGVFIAASVDRLLDTGVRFEPKLKFHFLDLDFSRSARAAGLRLGIYPIAITHMSGGAYGSPDWREARALYFEKWSKDSDLKEPH